MEVNDDAVEIEHKKMALIINDKICLFILFIPNHLR